MMETVPRRSATAEPQQPLVPVTIRLPKDLHKRLVRVAAADDRTLASLIVHAARLYADEFERKHVL